TMHNIATPYNQDASSAQLSEFSAQSIMICWPLCLIQAQLHNRNRGIGKHLRQNRPGAVIESPPLIKADIRTLNGRLRQLCQGRRARSGILLVEEFLRKSAEVVNRWWTFHARHQCSSCFPMGGDTQDRIRSGQDTTHIGPGTAVFIVFDGVHWATMTNEERGHFLVRRG